MSYTYRIKYKKKGSLKFISHLDLNALFSRTLRRAQMPVELTQGYNTRFKVSFGPALPLGIAGLQEILDLFLTEELEPEQIREKITSVAPTGLIIKKVQKVPENYSSLTQSLCWAVYRVFLGLNRSHNNDNDGECVEKIGITIKSFLNHQNILVEKQTKKGIREVDLRPCIHNLEFLSWQDEKIIIRLTIDIQYKGSINPYLVMNEFLKQSGNQRFTISKVIREKLMVDVDGKGKNKLESAP